MTRAPTWQAYFDRWSTVVAVYLVFAAVFCFLGIQNFGFISMEGMIEDGSQHMLAEGQWLVPHVYDEIYTYKPPLAYWLGTMPLLVVDDVPSAWFFRLPFVACAASLGLVVLIVLGRLVSPRCGLLCALASTSSVLFIEKARLAEFDTAITFFVGLAITLAMLALSGDRSRPLLWLCSYLALFCGFLAKGVPALMAFGPGVLLAAYLTQQLGRLFRWDHLVPATVFVALLALYVWGVVRAVGWDGFTLPAQEARVRGFTWDLAQFGRTLLKPPMVALAFIPFTVFLPRVWALYRANHRNLESRLLRISMGFVVGGVIAFTVVPTAEMRYFLPLAAPIGILCGLGAHASLETPTRRFETIALRSISAVLILFVPASWFIYEPALATMFVLGAAGVLVIWAALKSTEQYAGSVQSMLAIAVFIAITYGLVVIPSKAETRDLSGVALQIGKIIPMNADVCTNGPADKAGKYSSLFTNLDREVYVLPDTRGRTIDWCIFWDPDRKNSFEDVSFEPVATFNHPYKTFYIVQATRPR